MSTSPASDARPLDSDPSMTPVPASLGKPKGAKTLADESAIRDLVYMFSDAATRGDEALLRAVWADDPVWTISEPMPAHWVGIDAIVEGFELRRYKQATDFMQSVEGVVVTVDGDAATSWAIMHELGHPSSRDSGYENRAYYLDRLVRTPDGWRFKRRDYVYLYVDTKPAPGKFFPPPASTLPGEGSAAR